jgi:hypothetical protein
MPHAKIKQMRANQAARRAIARNRAATEWYREYNRGEEIMARRERRPPKPLRRCRGRRR